MQNQRIRRSESSFHQNLTREDRAELLKLQTLRELPKSKYATQKCITGIPSGRGRKVIYSHIEIYKMVEDIATDLREAGVRPQTPCAFVLENSIEAVVYFLALQWIGAIAVPIDPSLPAKDITSTLKEVQATTVVSAFVDEDERDNDELFKKIAEACNEADVIQWYITRTTNRGVFVNMCGRRAGEGAAWAGGAGDLKYDPSETCFRIAHGEKGQRLEFEMSHRGAAEATREYARTYDLTAEMSMILVSPFYSIHGLMCVLATMYSGGNIVFPTGSDIQPVTIMKHIKEYKVHWFSTHPDTVLDLFETVKADASLAQGLNLSFIRSVGGNISTDVLEAMEPAFRATVLEAYGTPETCALVSANNEFECRRGTCGKAVGGFEVAIICPKTKTLLPPEKEGNIGVRGHHVVRGYTNNEYANKSCYVDVTEGESVKTFFLTGDTGSLSKDGYLKVTSFGQSKKRAGLLAAEEEHEIRSQRELEAAVALQAAEDRERDEQARLEEERAVRLEEARRQEEERKIEEDRRREEERAAEEAKKLEAEQTPEETVISDSEDEEAVIATSDEPDADSDEVESDSNRGSENQDRHIPVPVAATRTVVERAPFDQGAIDKIMGRLDQIEENQKRLEEEIEGSHRVEMEKMRELIEKFEKARSVPPPQEVNVDMDAVNSAVSKAAASAESSSRDTAAAAKAAKEAAEAAAAAVAAQKDMSKSVVEVQDPSAIQKSVLVSLEEVEQAMRLHPAVESARAFGRPDPRFGVEVFCAINPKKGARVSEPWLKLHAQSMLPAACVPKRFFYKEALNDEEDRAALSEDNNLKRISEMSGFSNTKIIKSPAWTPQPVL